MIAEAVRDDQLTVEDGIFFIDTLSVCLYVHALSLFMFIALPPATIHQLPRFSLQLALSLCRHL